MWIRTIPEDEATGRLAEAYGWQAQRLGHPTEFTTLGSLDPEIVHARLVLYKASERCPSALTATQRAIVAYVTSVLNDTPHCFSQVRVKLRELGFSEDDIVALDEGRYETLPAADEALARYTRTLTRDPGAIVEADIEGLRAAGFGDLEILDANNMCAHLNYTNRVANGLGLKSLVAEDYPAFAAIPR
jgi:uncharacterized peroxidase-related enzyme